MRKELFAAKKRKKTQNKSRTFFALSCAFLWLMVSSCADLQKPKIEEFYGAVTTPKKQEFRWSNGKLPKQLDPALASASPETDLVRAVYEGLTDLDAKTLEAKPAVAERWDISADGRTWTFHLRKDAKWTTGKSVTAKDFVRSWRRLAEMGAAVPNSRLLKNIVGAENFAIDDGISVLPPEEFDVAEPEKGQPVTPENNPEPAPVAPAKPADTGNTANTAGTENLLKKGIVSPPNIPAKEQANKISKWLGVEAVDDQTLRVWLIQPDRNFSAVVAHPVFSPIHEIEGDLAAIGDAPKAVTNGAFRVSSVAKEEVLLTRSDSFWGRDQIGLELVHMIARPDAENALAAYRVNDLDAITNTHFEPLALKLLTPYQDFRRSTHNALTFYQFNTGRQPFGDVRVRRALAMAIERERLVQDEMDGAGEPARDFLPFAESEKGKLKENFEEAKKLLAEAGFADGSAFPKIRLLINRNDLQRRIANSVRQMWKKHLGIETEVIIKDRAEYEEAIKNGDYDLARRGVVLPTANEVSSLLAMFDAMPDTDAEIKDLITDDNSNADSSTVEKNPAPNASEPMEQMRGEHEAQKKEAVQTKLDEPQKIIILSEDVAMEKLPAIPLYFPISNSLVKPYVSGFDTNLLDAPSLKTVVINNNWKNSQTQK